MTNERIFLSSPHMGDLEQKFVQEAFDTNWIAPLGPNVNAFEKELAEYVGINDAAATGSGTAAIHLALRLLNVQKDDIVFCSSLTFIASANPILYQGAIPVFIDSEPDSWNMSPVALRKAFEDAKECNQMPKAVIIVNLYGQSADMDALISICKEYNVPVVEDAAESLGAIYKGMRSGTFGEFGIFSFNGNKIITTSGGGMLISNNVEAVEKARFYATQARDPAPHYQHSQLGYNYRMSNVLAGIGRGQLRVLEDRVNARRAVFQRYYDRFGMIDGIDFMPEAPYGKHTRWLTALTINPAKTGFTRDDLLKVLADENIEGRPVWKPLHLQPLFEGCKYFSHEESKSVSDDLFEYGICLPSGSNMTKEQQDKVIYTIQKLIDSKN